MKKIWKWIFGIAAGFLILLIFTNVILDDIIGNMLKNKIAKQSNGVYELSFNDLNINLFTGSLSARDVQLKYDSARFHKMRREVGSSVLFEVSVSLLQMEHLDLPDLIFEEKLILTTLVINEPRVKMISHPEMEKAADTASSKGGLYSIISPAFKVLAIGKINLIDASLNYKMHKAKVVSSTKVRNISLMVSNFQIDSMASADTKRLFYSDAIELKVTDYSMKLPDSMNLLKVKEFGISLSEQKIYADSIQLVPRYGKFEFAKMKGHETDYNEITNKRLEFNQVDFEALFEKQQFKAAFLEVDGLILYSFRDKRWPFPENRRPYLPQEMLHNAGFYLKIDSVKLKNMHITYEERVEDAEEAGTIRFENLNAVFYNVSNDSILAKEGVSMQIYASAQLMGKALLQANFDMPLASKNNEHTFEGSLAPVPLKIINPMMRPIAFAEIESGYNNKLTFSAHANNDISEGIMRFAYEDLKINLLKEGEGTKDIISFFANTIVPADNPGEDNSLQVGEMKFERDKRKSIINFWWKTLLTGLKSTLGVKNEPEKEADN